MNGGAVEFETTFSEQPPAADNRTAVQSTANATVKRGEFMRLDKRM
jgi:hypothetical protein